MKMQRMMSVGTMVLIALCSFVLTGCLNDKDNAVQPTVPVSYVALFNASPDAPGLNILVDNNQINTTPFAYSNYTGYLPFHTGERRIEFGPFGASNAVVDTTLNLVNNGAYSIYVVNEYSKASVLFLQDTAASPASGKAKLRFVNLSPDAGTVQLNTQDGIALADAESFKQASQFKDVSAANYTLTVTGSGITALELPSVDLIGGKYYTVLIKGYKTLPAGNEHVLSAEVISN